MELLGAIRFFFFYLGILCVDIPVSYYAQHLLFAFWNVYGVGFLSFFLDFPILVLFFLYLCHYFWYSLRVFQTNFNVVFHKRLSDSKSP